MTPGAPKHSSGKRVAVPLLILGFGVLVCQLGAAQAGGPAKVFPGQAWSSWEKPESAGFNRARLDALSVWLKANRTTSMMVSVGGRILFEYGDVAHVSKVASVRKSILAMLFGKYVLNGTIDLDRTVKQLGLDDVQPFLPIEERATLRQLITARSGVYLPSGDHNLDPLLPRRGSQHPGTYFQYNNWDFDAAGTAFEKLTGRDIFDALESNLARPIDMQDFDRSRQRKNSMMPESKHPEYAMYLSTRDMARLGLLMLRHGAWSGKRLIPEEWCFYTTTLVTPYSNLHPTSLSLSTMSRRWGYGVLWWVWDAPPAWPGVVTGPYQGAYTAWGAGGQYITVLPALDMVIAHKVDIDDDPDRAVEPYEFDAILQMVIACVLKSTPYSAGN